MKNKTLVILLFTTLLSLLYYQANADKISARLGEKYFKQNNISKSQEYFEKAFDAGYNDSNSREIYVNSIINSPMTLESQEKLVKFLNYPINDSARLKAEYFVFDFTKEIHNKYPLNYISQAVFNQKIIRWGKLPITYGFISNGNIPSYFYKEIENAFKEWEKALNQTITFEMTSKNPNIIINFNPNNPSDTKGQKYVVAYTSPIIDSNKLQHMKINFYLKDNEGNYFTQNQVYKTALHEIFHAMGFMGHSYDKNNIMYLSKDPNEERDNLTLADINTAKLLYKIKPEITNSNELESEYLPYFVIGNEKEINKAKTKEAKNYIKKAPSLSSGYIDLAESYVANKEYTKAIKSLEKALALSNTNEIDGIIYYNLAAVYYYTENMDAAEEYAKKAIEFNDTEELHYILAEVAFYKKNNKDGINELEYLIRKKPDNIEYTIALANFYIKNKEFFKARKVLKNYINKNPQDKNNKRLDAYGIIKFGL